MVRNQWYAVLESKELKNKLLAVKRLNENMVFWRDETGDAVCMLDKCAHRFAALSKGKINFIDHIQCPFHGLEYNNEGKMYSNSGTNSSL